METIHDDVKLLLNSDPLDALELIAEDPAYYFALVETYRQTADGQEIYLPALLNINLMRINDKVSIKFKLSADSRWYEVGYENGTEAEAYSAFSKKIGELVRYPPPERAHLIEESLADIKVPLSSSMLEDEEEAVERVERAVILDGAAVEETPASDFITKLRACESLCKPRMRGCFQSLIRCLTSTDPFVHAVVDTLVLGSTAEQIITLNFLQGYNIEE
jgi:hypothetical protein